MEFEKNIYYQFLVGRKVYIFNICIVYICFVLCTHYSKTRREGKLVEWMFWCNPVLIHFYFFFLLLWLDGLIQFNHDITNIKNTFN